jgi:hypothetical protein
LDRELAHEWQDVYENGLQQIHLPRSVFEELIRQGIIRPDGYYPGRSCYVPPDGLAIFNDAIAQGSPNLYEPQGG